MNQLQKRPTFIHQIYKHISKAWNRFKLLHASKAKPARDSLHVVLPQRTNAWTQISCFGIRYKDCFFEKSINSIEEAFQVSWSNYQQFYNTYHADDWSKLILIEKLTLKLDKNMDTSMDMNERTSQCSSGMAVCTRLTQFWQFSFFFHKVVQSNWFVLSVHPWLVFDFIKMRSQIYNWN